MKKSLEFVVCLMICGLAPALTNIPFTETNSVVLNFDAAIPPEVRQSISNDFDRCFEPMRGNRRILCNADDPQNYYYWVKLWQPYSGFPFLCDQGPHFPEYGTLSNGTFTIDIDYSFASSHSQRLLDIKPYSNEMAQAYSFLESLSPTNLQAMAADELVGQYLWKEVPPGENPIPEDELYFAVQSMRATLFFPPPLFAFHLSDVGPTNNPPYLWCEIPCRNFRGELSHNAMIYFQNRWWLSVWPFQEGEQQW